MNPALCLLQGTKYLEMPVSEQDLVHPRGMGLRCGLHYERTLRVRGKWVDLLRHPHHLIRPEGDFLNRRHIRDLRERGFERRIQVQKPRILL